MGQVENRRVESHGYKVYVVPRCLELFIGRLVYYSHLLVLAYLDIRS